MDYFVSLKGVYSALKRRFEDQEQGLANRTADSLSGMTERKARATANTRATTRTSKDNDSLAFVCPTLDGEAVKGRAPSLVVKFGSTGFVVDGRARVSGGSLLGWFGFPRG